MIISFKHRGLKRYFNHKDASGINPEHLKKVNYILTKLNEAPEVEDMDDAAFHLHQLIGNRAGEWSVTVRANWRITFRFEDGNATDVNYEDYH